MIERQTGDIININRWIKWQCISNQRLMKFKVVLGLTDSLMQEVRKHNIRVTALT
jgi:3-oxoacyl-[acyl-carrier protein] reductase